jgi:hypothetical protein
MGIVFEQLYLVFCSMGSDKQLKVINGEVNQMRIFSHKTSKISVFFYTIILVGLSW